MNVLLVRPIRCGTVCSVVRVGNCLHHIPEKARFQPSWSAQPSSSRSVGGPGLGSQKGNLIRVWGSALHFRTPKWYRFWGSFERLVPAPAPATAGHDERVAETLRGAAADLALLSDLPGDANPSARRESAYLEQCQCPSLLVYRDMCGVGWFEAKNVRFFGVWEGFGCRCLGGCRWWFVSCLFSIPSFFNGPNWPNPISLKECEIT